MAAQENKRIEIKVSQGNINNGHFYIDRQTSIFPRDAWGGANKNLKAVGFTLEFFGTGERVETDIDGSKRIPRNARGQCKLFFRRCKINDGDYIQVEKIGDRVFRVSPVKSSPSQLQKQSPTPTKVYAPTAVRLNNTASDPSSRLAAQKKSDEAKMQGLLIREPHIGRILSGKKTWEMRKGNCRKHETIALIKSGSGTVVGIADIAGSLPRLTEAEMLATYDKHQLDASDVANPEMADWRTPWILKNIKKLDKPVPYEHPKGAVIWAALSDDVIKQIQRQVNNRCARACSITCRGCAVCSPAQSRKVERKPY
jgi:hypothetical protein